jgi:hypothetical protein
MGFLDWLFGRRGQPEEPDESVDDVADRIGRYGDRFRNAGDTAGERAAREAALAARQSVSVEEALRIEHDFLSAHGLLNQPVPSAAKPRVGRGIGPTGLRYVQFGNNVRVGGSRGWRNYNPGYIRCSDQAVYYGAISCDGEFAIFPDDRTGLNALMLWLPQHYPSHTVREALQEQLPPEEAGEGAAERIEQQMGLDPETPVKDLSPADLQSIGDACQSEAGRTTGDTYDSGGSAPDWVEDLWSQSDAAEVAEASSADSSDARSTTDDS